MCQIIIVLLIIYETEHYFNKGKIIVTGWVDRQFQYFINMHIYLDMTQYYVYPQTWMEAEAT